MKVPAAILEAPEAGFVNLNYQSELIMTRTSVQGLRAQTDSFLRSTVKSIIVLNGSSSIDNCTAPIQGSGGAISVLSAKVFIIDDMKISKSNKIKI